MALEYLGGPAPLFENPAQVQAGLMSLLMAFLMLLSVIAVTVNKMTEETCIENLLGFFSAVASFSFLSAIVFLHVAMTRLGSDSQWLRLNFLMGLLTYAVAMTGAWGAILLTQSSSIYGVKQCFQCIDPATGAARAASDPCVETDSCDTTSYKSIKTASDCPGTSNGGNPYIDCEIDFLCEYQAPKTFAMGAVLTSFTLLFSIIMSYISFVKFLPNYVLSQRKILKFK
jgi:hypothetical protein